MMQNGEEEGWEYFQKLTDQANSIPDSGSGPTKGAALGEAHVAVGFDFMAYEHQNNGETVDFIVPENTPILVNPATLVKDGPNPEGGKNSWISCLVRKLRRSWQIGTISQSIRM